MQVSLFYHIHSFLFFFFSLSKATKQQLFCVLKTVLLQFWCWNEAAFATSDILKKHMGKAGVLRAVEVPRDEGQDEASSWPDPCHCQRWFLRSGKCFGFTESTVDSAGWDFVWQRRHEMDPSPVSCGLSTFVLITPHFSMLKGHFILLSKRKSTSD